MKHEKRVLLVVTFLQEQSEREMCLGEEVKTVEYCIQIHHIFKIYDEPHMKKSVMILLFSSPPRSFVTR